MKKVCQRLVFSSGENLQRIYVRNRPKLLTNSNPGVYQLDAIEVHGGIKEKCWKMQHKTSTRQHEVKLEMIQDTLKIAMENSID